MPIMYKIEAQEKSTKIPQTVVIPNKTSTDSLNFIPITQIYVFCPPCPARKFVANKLSYPIKMQSKTKLDSP